MKKKIILPLLLCLATAWLAVVHTAAATRYSDGVYTFEKTENNTAVVCDCNLTDNEIKIPDFVLGYPVTGIGDYAFLNNGYVNTVTLPASVASIGSYAFAQCESLERVNISRRCNNIAENAFFNSPNVTIGCYYNTAAHTFAKEHFISCVFLNSVTLGDTNGDKNVSIGDVTAIQRHIAELRALDGIYLFAADINADNVTDIKDATSLQMYLAQYDTPYPIDTPITADYSKQMDG
jgi:hypothetical protein